MPNCGQCSKERVQHSSTIRLGPFLLLFFSVVGETCGGRPGRLSRLLAGLRSVGQTDSCGGRPPVPEGSHYSSRTPVQELGAVRPSVEELGPARPLVQALGAPRPSTWRSWERPVLQWRHRDRPRPPVDESRSARPKVREFEAPRPPVGSRDGPSSTCGGSGLAIFYLCRSWERCFKNSAWFGAVWRHGSESR